MRGSHLSIASEPVKECRLDAGRRGKTPPENCKSQKRQRPCNAAEKPGRGSREHRKGQFAQSKKEAVQTEDIKGVKEDLLIGFNLRK